MQSRCNERPLEIIGGHQRQSEVSIQRCAPEIIIGHQRSLEIISGHQRSSEAIRGEYPTVRTRECGRLPRAM